MADGLNFVHAQRECDVRVRLPPPPGWNVDVAVHHLGPDGTREHLEKSEGR